MQEFNDLKERWLHLANLYSDNREEKENLFREIIHSYSEKGRYYHNLSHLQQLFVLYDQFHEMIKDKASIQFAIWYHDIVYSTLNPKKNEEKSAAIAKERLATLGVNSDIISKTENLILATKTHALKEEELDGLLFLDMDLAILGANKKAYTEYADQIRKEFSMYPDFLYKKGRKKALIQILNNGKIFKTDYFKAELEEKAISNIKDELEGL